MKTKKLTRSKAMKLADSAFSLYIRNRDNWTCVCCGAVYRDQRMHCGHMIRRGRGMTRFDEDNCHAQCFKCNFTHNYHPHIMEAKVLKKIGADRFAALLMRGAEVRQWKIGELVELTHFYKEKS